MKLKVLVFGKSKRRMRTNYYFWRGFRELGHQAKWVKFQKVRRFLGRKWGEKFCRWYIRWFQPDIIYLDATDIPYDLLVYAKDRARVFIYYDDCIKGSSYLDKITKFGQVADKFYLTAKGEVSYYREQGINAEYMPGGVDKDHHYPMKNPPEKYHSEVAFIGRPNREERIEFIKAVNEKFDLKVWGGGWEEHGITPASNNAYPHDYRGICAGAKVVLGWNIDPTVELYFSNRTWFSLGCGACYVTLYCPKLEEMFERGVHMDWFKNTEEALEKIQYYIDHPDKQKLLAQEGYKLAHEKYNFTLLAKKMVDDYLELEKSSEAK